MRQNRRCQIYWQILHPEKNVIRSTVLSVRGRKSRMLLGGKTLGLWCSADTDRIMYNKWRRSADRSCWCGVESRHKFSVRAISSVHADGQNFEYNAKMRSLHERSGASTHKFCWREWQVNTNQTSHTEYNRE